MGVAVLGIFSNNIQGIEGGILLGISHGFVSPALFICVGGIIYTRIHTRIIKYISGIVNRMPIFTLLFFLFILFNTAVPLSLNYLGELLSLTGVFFQSPFISLLGATGIVLSAAYSIWVYARMSYGSFSDYQLFNSKGVKSNPLGIGAGEQRILSKKEALSTDMLSGQDSHLLKNNSNISSINDINRREFFILLPLFFATIILGIYPDILLDSIHTSVTKIIYTPSL